MWKQLLAIGVAGATFSFGLTAHAQESHDEHGHHHGGHEQAGEQQQTQAGPHGGLVQHTGQRAYEFVRHERAGMLFLYTHQMQPIDVRKPETKQSKTGPREAPAKGLAVAGALSVIREDGGTTAMPLVARTDSMTGATYLHVDLPANLGDAVQIECEVRVDGEKSDTVTFENPPVVPMHQSAHPGQPAGALQLACAHRTGATGGCGGAAAGNAGGCCAN